MKKLPLLLLTITALALTARAQQTRPPAADDRAVANEDGGQAYIIERNSQPLSALGHPRKGMFAPEQISIFVGGSWSTAAMRERKQQLQGLMANVTDESDLAAIQARGIKNRFAPTVAVERLELSPRTFSDLDIQRLLASMLESSAVPEPNPKSVFIVFLDANFRSTLGPLSGGKHYVAYHNTFRSAGMDVRYIVVPFESDEATGYQIALRALVAAATIAGALK